jgi:hypothetical protein
MSPTCLQAFEKCLQVAGEEESRRKLPLWPSKMKIVSRPHGRERNDFTSNVTRASLLPLARHEHFFVTFLILN